MPHSSYINRCIALCYATMLSFMGGNFPLRSSSHSLTARDWVDAFMSNGRLQMPVFQPPQLPEAMPDGCWLKSIPNSQIRNLQISNRAAIASGFSYLRWFARPDRTSTEPYYGLPLPGGGGKFTTSIQPARAYEDESVIMSGPH